MTVALAQAGLNLFVAACLGASIGLERQWRQHLAGLRTNTLVALGAAIFITYGAPPGTMTARRGSRPRSCPASAFSGLA